MPTNPSPTPPNQRIVGGRSLSNFFRGALEAFPLRWRAKAGVDVTTRQVPTETDASALTPSLVQSNVEQTQINERKKTDAEINDLTASMVENLVLDNGLRATRTLSIPVEGSAQPASSFLTVEGQQNAFGTGQVEQAITSVASYPAQPGQDYDEEYNILIPFTQQTVALGGGVGTAATDSEPADYARSTIKTINLSATRTALDGFRATYPGTVQRLELPDVLVSIDTTWESSQTTSTYAESGSGIAIGKAVSMSLSPNGSAESSASLIPDLAPLIQSLFVKSKPVIDYFLFLPTPVTLTQVKSALSSRYGISVNDWPTFRPVAHNITLIGHKISLSARVSVQQGVSLSNTDINFVNSSGVGHSGDVGTVVKTVSIPPTIHGDITIANSPPSVAASSRAQIGWTAGTNWPSATADTGTITASPTATISPVFLPATSPSAIPVTGLYIQEINGTNYKYGYQLIQVRVFDFDTL